MEISALEGYNIEEAFKAMITGKLYLNQK